MILTIKSNDGWQEVFFKEKKRVRKKDDIILLFEVTLRSNNWDTEESLNDSFNELVLDKTISYNQIGIDKNNWDKFLELANKWVSDGILFEHVFYDELGELFKIKLDGTSDKLISSPEKPNLSFMLKDTRSKIDFDMIIDRTSFINEMLEN